MNALILASSSPRRRELLAGVGVAFEVIPANVPESRLAGETGRAMVERLALAKAEALAALYPDRFVLAADTTVVLDEETVLEKPVDDSDAIRMLSLIQGRSHLVFTAFALVHLAKRICESQVVQTEVICRPLKQSEIEAYVATGEPLDKAGAYGAQGRGAFFVQGYRGSYTNVIGLPVVEVLQVLERYGVWSPQELPR